MSFFTEDHLLTKEWAQKALFCKFKAGFGLKCLERGDFEALRAWNPFDDPVLKAKL